MTVDTTYQTGVYQNQGGDTLTIGTDGKLSTLEGATAAESASGLFIGGGTAALPCTTATASAKFVEWRCETTAASGDNRLQYMWYFLAGGGGGECLRAMTSVQSNVGTAHGAHLSLEFDATAGGSECSGLGAAVRGTLHIPDIASWAPTGTYTSGMFEIYSDGTASDPAGMTELSVLRLCNSGGTGKADVDTDAFIFSLQGWTAGTTTTKAISSLGVAELPGAGAGGGGLGLRVKIGSGTYYIPAVQASEWN